MGEFDLIAAIRSRLPAGGPRVLLGSGDDAAVTRPAAVTATSVDAVVEGIHFRRPESSLEQIGRRALATALSDLAAMGASPGEAYVALGVPEDLGEEGSLELFAGLEALAAESETTLAGGDITRSPTLFVAVTVVGHAEDAALLVARRGAAEGDQVAVTGELGGAAAGLLLLERGRGDLPQEVAEPLIRRHLEPRPRLAEGRALGAGGATAMIDLSDGLGADACHVAAESGVRLDIDMSAVPLASGLERAAEALGEDPLELAAGGGDDYELLACLPEESVTDARDAVTAAGGSLTVIGRCAAGGGVSLSASGRELRVRGYDQLS
jgi:thiamine-monophosphate kinase